MRYAVWTKVDGEEVEGYTAIQSYTDAVWFFQTLSDGWPEGETVLWDRCANKALLRAQDSEVIGTETAKWRVAVIETTVRKYLVDVEVGGGFPSYQDGASIHAAAIKAVERGEHVFTALMSVAQHTPAYVRWENGRPRQFDPTED